MGTQHNWQALICFTGLVGKRLITIEQFLLQQFLLTELTRIRLHGFSDREVQLAQALMLSGAESDYIKQDQDRSQVRLG